jgi:7-cyano-7-deazaguanine synthase in queuosine biosynthesis
MTHSYLILLSGGLDSATLLADVTRGPATVAALAVDYGQRHFPRTGCSAPSGPPL